MEANLKYLLSTIDGVNSAINIQLQIAQKLGCEPSVIETFEKVISLSTLIKDKAAQGEIRKNYVNQFRSDLETISAQLPYRGHDPSFVDKQDAYSRSQLKEGIEKSSRNISRAIDQIKFNVDFFNKIGYFENNIVAIGANGSGKTSLSNKFKSYLNNNGVVISAQRILFIPTFDTIANPTNTANMLKQSQVADKSNKSDRGINSLQGEFKIVLNHLLAENITAGHNYRTTALASKTVGKVIDHPDKTNLDMTFEIWNSLIEHRKISCEDGINITVTSKSSEPYHASQMSDGEKVMLFLIAQVLQAPSSGFIVVDEPEMFLHKTILKKLWDILESRRSDCIFIYLTHDLDFATSRTTAKKVWIKSFTPPEEWEIEDIPTNDIPENLMLELLGSRKNILFCEGSKGSIDEQIYSILFPNLTIIPVGSCFEVINHTKAFNKLKNVNTKAFGLIDSDHHDPKRLEKLNKEYIYSFKVAEVENLFLDTDFLKVLTKQIMRSEEDVESIKADIIKELEQSKEIQASNYVSSKVNYYFSDSDLSKGNSLDQLKNNYDDFLSKISIDDWYTQRIAELDKMITNADYKGVLLSFNNKGLRQIGNKWLKITDFANRGIKLLQTNDEARSALTKYFPEEIRTADGV